MKRLLLTYLLCSLTLPFVFGQELKVGQKAPEITLQTRDGKEVSLSSLRGQVVLIDFWASWCAPCRRENPKLALVQKEFKDVVFKTAEGFSVFSISLDNNKTIWHKAIEKDRTKELTNVIDLKGFKGTLAKTYGIKRIPSSFLIDAEGYIIAINVNSEELTQKLHKMKKKKYRLF